MGKNAQRRRGDDQQPQIDHFLMNGDTYIAIRRYLGSRPYDETRQLVQALDNMPAVTTDDMAVTAKRAERLQELEDHIVKESKTVVCKGTVLDYVDQVVAHLEEYRDKGSSASDGLHDALDRLESFRARLEGKTTEDMVKAEDPEPETEIGAETGESGRIVDNPDDDDEVISDLPELEPDPGELETADQEGA